MKIIYSKTNRLTRITLTVAGAASAVMFAFLTIHGFITDGWVRVTDISIGAVYRLLLFLVSMSFLTFARILRNQEEMYARLEEKEERQP